MKVKGPQASDADVAWAEERTIALMHEGLPFADACTLAARECSERVIARETQAQERHEAKLAAMREEREKVESQQRADHRAELARKAEFGSPERSSLKVSLGDLLTASRGRR
jgi:hypothetical protein